jgi:hypothetical protein
MKSCKHRDIWIISSGSSPGWLWCYRCGGIRPNKPGRHPWTKPVGPDGENPVVTEMEKEDRKRKKK